MSEFKIQQSKRSIQTENKHEHGVYVSILQSSNGARFVCSAPPRCMLLLAALIADCRVTYSDGRYWISRGSECPSGRVEIPEKDQSGNVITGIYKNCFSRCSSLESVDIPPSIRVISWFSFEGCSSLKAIVLPESVEEIHAGAFANCSSLESITLPLCLSSLHEEALYNCPLLSEVTMGVTVSPHRLPKTVRRIKIHSGVTEIPSGFFTQCTSLEEIELPDSVEGIAGDAFFNCSSLSGVTMGVSISPSKLPETVRRIMIRTGVTGIPPGFFFNCYSLEAIELPESIEEIGDGAFEGCSSLVSVSGSSSGSVNIPPRVQVIPSRCFYGCSSLTDVIVPPSVTQIGDEAFAQCPSISSFTYQGSSQLENDIGLPDTVHMNNAGVYSE